MEKVSSFLLVSFFILLIMPCLFFISPRTYATTTTVIISPNTATTVSSSFDLTVTIDDVTDMAAWSITLIFRKQIVLTAVAEETGLIDGLLSYTNESKSYCTYQVHVFSSLTTGDVSGSGDVASLSFTAKCEGPASLVLSDSLLLDSNSQAISCVPSVCSVMVVGTPWKSYLNITTPTNGVINTTGATTVLANTTIKTVFADQALSVGKFDYFLLDGIQNVSNLIHISMIVDHNLSAIFHIPHVVINTSASDVAIVFGEEQGVSNSSGMWATDVIRGNYSLSISKTNCYPSIQTVSILDNIILNVTVYRILYYKESIPNATQISSLSGSVEDIGIPELNYLDMESLIYCEPDSGETATVTFSTLYGTNYPRIEIQASHTNVIYFDLSKVWQSWTMENPNTLIQNSGFFGLKINTTDDLAIIITLPKQPRALWKTTQTGQITQYSSWSYANQNITLTVTASDPTFSFDYTTVGSELNQAAIIVSGFFSIVLIIGMVAALREGVEIKHILWMPLGVVIMVIIILIISQLPVMNA